MNEIAVREYFDVRQKMPAVELSRVDFFDARQIFECGQCFRFDRLPDGRYEGVAKGKYLCVGQPEKDRILLIGATLSDYETVWRDFFALDEDYAAIQDDIYRHFLRFGSVIREAVQIASGIRILRQEPWEALASFILSQNNNIPRIKKMIRSLSEGLGEPFSAFGKTYHAFPSAQAVFCAGAEGLAPHRLGFRSRYLLDAAEKYLDGRLDFDTLRTAPLGQTETALMSVLGVGKKVAACAMLYGLHRTEAFPIDVWMRRVLDRYYPKGIDPASLGPYAGIAQQYLFYYERERTSQEKAKKRA